MSSTANDTVVSLWWTSQHQDTRFQYLRISKSQLVPLAAYGLQDCHEALPVSVGECDSMSRRSRSVKPFKVSRALARPPDGMLSSSFQTRAQRVSIEQSGQRSGARAVSSGDNTLAAWFLSRVCHSVSMLFRNSRLSAGVNWLIFISLRCRTCRAPGETVKMPLPLSNFEAGHHSFLLAPQATGHLQRSHHFLFPYRMTQSSIPEFHYEQLVKVVLRARRLAVSCHHGLPLSLVVQYLWWHWKAVRLVGSYLTVRVFPRIRLRACGWCRWTVYWMFILSSDVFVREVTVL